MKLKGMIIKDFKGIHEMSLELNGKNTILFGVNGTGKSSVLAVINYCFWIWVNRLNPSQGTTYKSFLPELIHAGSRELSINTDVALNGFDYTLGRACKKISTGFKSELVKSTYDAFVSAFNLLLADPANNIPIFVNYGTNRTVLDIPLRIRRKHDFSKLTALERAIENFLDFRTFFEWYRNQEDIENERIRETGDTNYQDIQLKCVRKAVETMLDNVSNLRVKRNPLRMVVNKGSLTVSVDLLSDGEKCTLAMIGDLARRIALANPNRDNPLEGEGIVLIDEIELHMHPSWQRRILGVLKRVFPNIQFIVTTHSPQVLGEVDDSFNVYHLFLNEKMETEVKTLPRLDGYDSNMILESYMNTRSVNQVFYELLEQTSDAIQEHRFDEAERLLERIRKWTSVNTDDYIRLDGLMKREKLLYAKNH